MFIKSKHSVLAMTCILVASISGCTQATDDYDDPMGEAMFELGRQMEPLQIDKIICAISIDTPSLYSDIGKHAYDELYYSLELKVAIPYSHTEMLDTMTYSYLPIDERCDEALALTKRIIQDTNPKMFPDVQIITVEELKQSIRLDERVE